MGKRCEEGVTCDPKKRDCPSAADDDDEDEAMV